MSRPRLAVAVILGALVVCAPAAQAQTSDVGLDIDFAALSKAKGGDWADYAVSVPGRDDLPTVRYALLEKTDKTLSLEIDAPTPKGDVDVRIDYAAAGPDTWTAHGGQMRFGDQVMDLPAQQVTQSLPLKKGQTPGNLLGTEEVKTPAGTFPCRHYRKTMTGKEGALLTFDLWMNEKVAPTGLVKSTMGPMTMTLSKVGKGAVSKIK